MTLFNKAVEAVVSFLKSDIDAENKYRKYHAQLADTAYKPIASWREFLETQEWNESEVMDCIVDVLAIHQKRTKEKVALKRGKLKDGNMTYTGDDILRAVKTALFN